MQWPSEREIEKAARVAAMVHPTQLLTLDERFEAARDGIIDALADGKTGDLRDLAKTGINKAVVARHHLYGIPRDTTSAKPHTGRGWQVYWHVTTGPTSFADDLVDNLAVRQVFEALPQRHQDTLNTYMSCGSIAGTASLLGIAYNTASERIITARNAAKKMWFEPDPAPPMWRRTMSGHEGGSWRADVIMRRARAKRKAREATASGIPGDHARPGTPPCNASRPSSDRSPSQALPAA